MPSLRSSQFLTGMGKALQDARLMTRLLLRGVARAGSREFSEALRRYARHPRNLLRGGPGRYYRGSDGALWVATAMPPVSDPDLADLLAEEVLAVARGTPLPLLFGLLSVSSRCPCRCRHCYALEDLTGEEQVPTEALLLAVEDLAEAGARSVFLTGGEPLMRADDLPSLVRRAREVGLRSFLVTTGIGSRPGLLRTLRDEGLTGVIVSLDARDPEAVNRVKGHPGAWDGAMGMLTEAVDLGLVPSTDCMVTPDLLEPGNFHAYLRFLTDIGVPFANFFPPHPSGGAARGGMAGLPPGAIGRLETLMNRWNEGGEALPLAWSAAVWEAPRGCVGGRQFVYVNPKGEVRACPFLPRPAGSIVTGRLREVLAALRSGAFSRGCAGDLERSDCPS